MKQVPENEDEDQEQPKDHEEKALNSQQPKGIKSEEKPQGQKRQPKQVTITDVELEQLKRDASEFKDKYLRALAESENARKRLQKERQELIQYALQNVIVDFLNPIDHMDHALKFTDQMSDEVKHWAQGFQMILTQFKDVLARNGVSAFVSVGKPFDPHFHEAIETVCTTEYPAEVVVEETLRGYKMNDRIIRPARVKVSKAPTGSKAKAEINTENTNNEV